MSLLIHKSTSQKQSRFVSHHMKEHYVTRVLKKLNYTTAWMRVTRDEPGKSEWDSGMRRCVCHLGGI